MNKKDSKKYEEMLKIYNETTSSFGFKCLIGAKGYTKDLDEFWKLKYPHGWC